MQIPLKSSAENSRGICEEASQAKTLTGQNPRSPDVVSQTGAGENTAADAREKGSFADPTRACVSSVRSLGNRKDRST